MFISAIVQSRVPQRRTMGAFRLWDSATAQSPHPAQSVSLLTEKAELAGKKQLEGISSFCRLAKHAKPAFQNRIRRRFNCEERLEESREVDVAEVAATDERQRINSGPDKNRPEPSFAQ